MAGGPVDVGCLARLEYSPCVHDRHPIGYLGHHPEVMGNPDHRQAVFGLQFTDQIHDLGLDGHIEGRGRFIGDQQFRLARQRHSNHGALAHTSREFVRVVVNPGLRRRYPNAVQEADGVAPCLGPGSTAMDAEALADLPTDAVDRVQ